jgi:hypothetical protein
MKSLFPFRLCLALLLSFTLLAALPAAEAEPTPEARTAAEQLRTDLLLPGITLAEGVSEITGVAISPLLGMSAIGAWTYYQTDTELRSRLPWYCHPYAWGFGLSLIAICFLKDTLGATVPALVKKPFDFLELFEDKLSALIASTAFVPLVALAMSQVERLQPQAMNAVADSGLALMPLAGVIDLGVHTPWISIPVAMIAFAVVWLSSHAINVLIALSPFGIIDAGLKLTKLGLLTLVTVSTALHPYLGATVSLLLILVGLLLAGWSYRLMIFGTLMGWDVLRNHRAAEQDLEQGVRGFFARRSYGVPVRSLGRMVTTVRGACFVYRPWLLLPERRIKLNSEALVLCRGLLHPSVAHWPDQEEKPHPILILLPRYRRLEAPIATRYGCRDIVDSPLLRGLKALRQWLSETFSFSRRNSEPNQAQL